MFRRAYEEDDVAILGKAAELCSSGYGHYCNPRGYTLGCRPCFPVYHDSNLLIVTADMGEMKWYVLRTVGGKEKRAKEYLEKEIERSGLQDQVAQVIVPVKREIVTKNNKRKVVERLLYPSYVLIQAEFSAKLENVVRNLVPGMTGFLTENRTFTTKGPDGESKSIVERVAIPLQDDEVKRILNEQDENANNAAETEVNYAVGDKVKITDGPFSGFNGTVDEIVEDRSKLKVIVVIFGRKTLLELSFTQVSKE